MNPIKGLVQIISGFGVGKTTFMLECGYHPKDIIFINDDIKEPPEFKYAKIINLMAETQEMTQLQFHDYCLRMIGNLPKSKVIIWDTWQRFEKTFHPYVAAHPKQFREKFSPMGKIKNAEMWIDSFDYEGAIFAKLRSKFNLVLLSTHLKSRYDGDVRIPDAYVPDQKKPLSKNADLRIWLTPNPNSQVPTGLVLKNISKSTLTDDGIKTKRVLPRRIDKCNWETIIDYYNNPIGDRKPKNSEIPNEFELSLIEGHLTSEQRNVFTILTQLSLKQKEEEKNTMQTAIKAIAISIIDESPTSILSVIKSQFENGESEGDLPTIGQIMQWKKEVRNI